MKILKLKKNKNLTQNPILKSELSFSNDIFYYIYVTKCLRFFFLVWYNDLTYTLNAEDMSKLLPTLCRNSSSWNFEKLAFLKIPPFINTIDINYIEANCK